MRSKKVGEKMTGAKKVIKVKNHFFHACQPRTVKEYLIFVHTSAVYSHFLSELQIAPIVLFVGINVPNFVQELLRTYILLIWVRQLEFQKIGLVW